MKYNKEIKGVHVQRDDYAEQFANKIKSEFKVSIYGETITESENKKELSRELTMLGTQLLKWAEFFDKHN